MSDYCFDPTTVAQAVCLAAAAAAKLAMQSMIDHSILLLQGEIYPTEFTMSTALLRGFRVRWESFAVNLEVLRGWDFRRKWDAMSFIPAHWT